MSGWLTSVSFINSAGCPAGSFDANLTFAQALTEAARAAPQALVVASLPGVTDRNWRARRRAGAGAFEEYVQAGVKSSWQPATADEGFEIVRRRLFEPISDKDGAAKQRRHSSLQRNVPRRVGEYPQGCGEGEYSRRMQAAYPIHPELFERLYNDWGSLDKFEPPRGVLRFMAAAIHVLWERGDGGLLILPANIPLDSPIVQGELVRYLDQNWSAVLAKDIDGATSVPLAIDQEVPTLGRYSATRRVARSIWMGSAPTFRERTPELTMGRSSSAAFSPGKRRNFGDALRRLADRATYLYQDSSRYWFSTQPSVARLAEDRAAQIETADVDAKIIALLKRNEDRRLRGDFAAVHASPETSADVADEPDTRLVVLGPAYPHVAKGDGGRAVSAAQNILETRGSGQRIYRNALVFLAADQQRLPETSAGGPVMDGVVIDFRRA